MPHEDSYTYLERLTEVHKGGVVRNDHLHDIRISGEPGAITVTPASGADTAAAANPPSQPSGAPESS